MKVDDPLSLLCALAPQQASTMNIIRVLILHGSLSMWSTHWFFVTDYSMEGDDIWMFKLSHDGCLLEEFYLVLFNGACL